MKAILTNKQTGERVKCKAETNHPASSYGMAVWVDSEGNALQQVELPKTLQSEATYSVEVLEDE